MRDTRFPWPFPPTIPCSDSPLAPAGPSGRFPAFTATTGCSESLPSVPSCFVSFAWRYRPVPVVRSRRCRPPPPGRGSLGRGFPNHCSDGGDGRASQVPGGPSRAHALLCDPGGILEPGQLRPSDAAFHGCNGVGFRMDCFEAQSHGLWAPRPTLRSPGRPGTTQGWVLAAGQLCQVGLIPPGPNARFPSELCHPSPPPRLGLAHYNRIIHNTLDFEDRP